MSARILSGSHRKRKTQSTWDRFFAKVNKTDSCWLWTGASSPYGHGLFKLSGTKVLASRASWILQHGSIPPGLHVLHRCSQTACVRTDHLYLGTPRENALDGNRRPNGKARLADYLKPKLDFATRFWAKVRKTADCWLWTGHRDRHGYGRVWLDTRRIQFAHRIAWELTNGSIADGLCCLHRCDEPACCRIDHLFLGTRVDNMHDMWAKGRGRKLSGGQGKANPRAKLSEADVREIRAMAVTGVSGLDIANRFGVTASAVSLIVRGKNWSSFEPQTIPGGRSRAKLTDEDVAEIRRLGRGGQKGIGMRFGINQSQVSRILSGKRRSQ